ncbi:MAG: carboxypeptidase-like regulatory domain-containing protein, partial [Odoribacter sp.]|nr:carboxypeptidase-like regulatory domain-containing protein [Odoribacter sp.]
MKKNRKDISLDKGNLLKIPLRTKLTFLLLVCAVVQLVAEVSAQPVSLKKQNASLEEIIWELKAKTHLVFLYSDEDIASVKGIDIDVRNLEADEVLRKCLKDTGLQCVKENGAIVIKQAKRETSAPQTQHRKITGKVTDKDGASLPGVTVLIEGTSMGVTTDDEGKYALECPSQGMWVLQFTFVGMRTQQVSVGGKTVIDVVMTEDTQEMDEVVVTGIYERKKESFTGSATTFKKEELKMVGTQNLVQRLRTQDPSFVMMENNQFGSEPNKLPDIEIRGKTSIIGLKEQFGTDPNQPLFILDGFETTLRTVMDLNMDRVESVTILKDAASTAIYGSKAANGVVVIETKKPEKGRFKVSYSGDFSISIPDLTDYNLMNAEEKLEFEWKAGYYHVKGNDAVEQARRDSLYNAHRAEVARGVNTYWMNDPLRVSFSHKHNVYAEGGDEQVRYGL